ncbi:HNH endonuclease signature motif containing protein [Xanthobacter lutulentifluminis]|uniref:HNH endonuclease signature motif containing protein n=1 Tax=Xanthobacter lutulentifluminis TaxID=3119935 RepID=UPI003735C82C
MEAHRASWMAFKGDIPNGLHVLHRCNTPSCVNPDHLYLGTNLDNAADRIAAGTQARPPRKIGEDHGYARLKEDEARQIKFGSLSASECAKVYSVSIPTVYAIRSGRNWSWLSK